MNTDDFRAKSMPSEEEIRRICMEEIQPKWTEAEEKNRGGRAGRPEWKVLQARLADLPERTIELIESINKNDLTNHLSTG